METATDEELKKFWRSNWLQSLIDLTDIERQQRWIDKRITNPGWSHTEFMERYFGDLCLPIDTFRERIRIGLPTQDVDDGYQVHILDKRVSQEEYNCIKDFHRALTIYNYQSYKSPEYILNDPAWKKIVSSGKKALVKLRKLVNDPDEKEILLIKGVPPLTVGDFTWPKSPTWFRAILVRLNLYHHFPF